MHVITALAHEWSRLVDHSCAREVIGKLNIGDCHQAGDGLSKLSHRVWPDRNILGEKLGKLLRDVLGVHIVSKDGGNYSKEKWPLYSKSTVREHKFKGRGV